MSASRDSTNNLKVTVFRLETLIEIQPNAFELISNWEGFTLRFTVSNETANQLVELLSEQKGKQHERLANEAN